jgi:hypothetical protein
MKSRAIPLEKPKSNLGVLATITLTIILASAGIRYWTYNSSIIGTDAAQYLGAARDYLTTGEFTESLTSEVFPRFLPLGLPVMTVGMTMLTVLDVVQSGVLVSFLFGSLMPGLVFLMGYRATRSVYYPFLAAGLIVFNTVLVNLSVTCMTDNPWIFFFLVLCWIMSEYLAKKSDAYFIGFSILLACLFGILYEIRYPSIYLLIGIPLVLAIINKHFGSIDWKKFACGILLFSIIGWTVVVGTAYRFYEANGFFTLIPGASPTVAIGEVKSLANLELFEINDAGTNTKWNEPQSQTGHILGELLSDPSKRLRIFVNNVRSNWLVLSKALWSSDHFVNDTVLIVLLTVIISLVVGFLTDSRKFLIGGKLSPLCLCMTYILAILTFANFVMYSLVNVNTRYMVQLAPSVVILISIFLACFVPFNVTLRPGSVYSNLIDVSKSQFYSHSVFSGICAIMSIMVLVLLAQSAWPELRKWKLRNLRYVEQAKKVNEISTDLGISPAIITSYSELALRASAKQISVPWTEEDPILLSKYIQNKGGTFIQVPSHASFDTINVGCPLHHFLVEVASNFPKSVLKLNPDPLFLIKEHPVIDFAEDNQSADNLTNVTLKPDETYLVLNEWSLYGKIPKDSEKKTSMVLSDTGNPRALLSSKPFHRVKRVGNVNDDNPVHYYQYIVFSTHDYLDPKLSLTNDAVASKNPFKYQGSRIYTIRFKHRSQKNGNPDLSDGNS